MALSTLPAEELAQLRGNLENKQLNASKLTKEIDQLKAQIADLSKTVGDIDQRASVYEKASDAVGEHVKDLRAYVKTQKTMLKAALSTGSAAQVEAKKDAALKELKDLQTKLEEGTKKAAAANAALDAAKDATAAAQKAYKAIADLPGANAEVVKDLSALCTAADKQGAANSLGWQYFLILVMEDQLGLLQELPPDQYKKQLNEAGSALAQASESQARAKDALDASLSVQQQAQKEFDDKRLKWRQEVLEAIPATLPLAPAAPAASTVTPVPA